MTREEAIDNIKHSIAWAAENHDNWCDSIRIDALRMALEALEQPEQKNGKKFIEIVAEYPAICTYPEYEGKPYFSIRYEENGEKIEGFGTYNLEVLSKYIREYFMGEKKGKWIKVEKLFHTRFHSDQPDTYHEYRCTVCLKASDKATNYCPNCGSKMEE